MRDKKIEAILRELQKINGSKVVKYYQSENEILTRKIERMEEKLLRAMYSRNYNQLQSEIKTVNNNVHTCLEQIMLIRKDVEDLKQ